MRLLQQSEWRVLTVWECALRGKTATASSAVAKIVKEWLESSDDLGQVVGAPILAGMLISDDICCR